MPFPPMVAMRRHRAIASDAMSRAISLLSVRIAALALALAASATAHAMTIREFRTLEANDKNGRAYGSYYLVGLMEDLLDASVAPLLMGSVVLVRATTIQVVTMLRFRTRTAC